jgi:drug/metabolite transporter (DMT)-like permease
MSAHRNSEGNLAPYLALITVQFLFATWPVVGKIVLSSLPAIALVGFRVAGATIVLVLLARMTGRLMPIAKADWPLLIISSLLGLVFNQWLFVKGLSLTTAINATLISTTIPISTLVVGMLFRTERGTWRSALGIIIAAVGVVCLIAPGRGGFSVGARLGDLLIISNSVCYGAYIAVSKDLMKRYNALSVVTWIFIVGCIPAIPVGLISLAQVSLAAIPISSWLAVIYIAVLPTAGAYFLNAWALARVPPSTVAIYIYLQPLFAFVIAPLVLGEVLGGRAVLASLLIFAGILLVARRKTSISIHQSTPTY